MAWTASAEVYAGSFGLSCDGAVPALLEATRLDRPHDLRVLDVGCGPGHLAARAAAHGASVTAIDPDPEMLALVDARGLAIRTRRGELPRLDLPDAGVDVTVANFVVNHLPDPRAGVREMARVTCPGGTVAFTVWPATDSVQSRLWRGVVAESGAQPLESTRLPPALDFERSPEGAAALLEESGHVQVGARLVRWEHRVDPEVHWRGPAGGIGVIGATVLAQDEPTRREMKAAYDRLVAPLLGDGELVLPLEAVLAVGRRPAE